MPDKLEMNEIRAAGMFPAVLELNPRDQKVILVDNYMRRSLSMLHGVQYGVGNTVQVSAEGAARIQAYGTGLSWGANDADTAPASYSSSNGIDDGNTYHRFDVLIETEEAVYRFKQPDGTYVSDIPLIVGWHSLLITTSAFHIKKRNTTAGTYNVTAFR